MKIKTGMRHIPQKKVIQLNHVFLNEDGSPWTSNDIINKFKGITGIEHRRYAETNQTSSDLAFLASEKAIENAESILKLLTTLFCSQFW
jgi:3-oxoacyl-[acyl-carrier-protein] synthase-3